MRRTYGVQGGGPSHIGLEIALTPVHMSLKSGKKLWEELGREYGGNPIFEIDEEHGSIVAVNQIEKIAYDHSEANEGELVWKCDYCGAYSKTKRVVDAHEQTCAHKE